VLGVGEAQSVVRAWGDFDVAWLWFLGFDEQALVLIVGAQDLAAGSVLDAPLTRHRVLFGEEDLVTSAQTVRTVGQLDLVLAEIAPLDPLALRHLVELVELVV
jgi:hypothetical protein